jgi:hypothetical protein
MSATITLYASVSAALVSSNPTVSNVAGPPALGICATDFAEARDILATIVEVILGLLAGKWTFSARARLGLCLFWGTFGLAVDGKGVRCVAFGYASPIIRLVEHLSSCLSISPGMCARLSRDQRDQGQEAPSWGFGGG